MEELQSDVTFIKHQLIRILSILNSDLCQCDVCTKRLTSFDCQSLRDVLSKSSFESVAHVNKHIVNSTVNTANSTIAKNPTDLNASETVSPEKSKQIVRLEKQLMIDPEVFKAAETGLRCRSRSLSSRNSPVKNSYVTRVLHSTSTSPTKNSSVPLNTRSPLSLATNLADMITNNKVHVLPEAKVHGRRRDAIYPKVKSLFGMDGLKQLTEHYTLHGGRNTAEHFKISTKFVYSGVKGFRKEMQRLEQKNDANSYSSESSSFENSEIENGSLNSSMEKNNGVTVKRKNSEFNNPDVQNFNDSPNPKNGTGVIAQQPVSLKRFKLNGEPADLNDQQEGCKQAPGFTSRCSPTVTDDDAVFEDGDQAPVGAVSPSNNGPHIDDVTMATVERSVNVDRQDRVESTCSVEAMAVDDTSFDRSSTSSPKSNRRIFTHEQDQQLFRVLASCQGQNLKVTTKMVEYAAKLILKHQPIGLSSTTKRHDSVSRSWAQRKLDEFHKRQI